MNAADPLSLGLALETIVKSCLILATALTLTWFMRRFSAAARHLCLAAAAVSLLALPIASAVLPSWQILSVPNPFAPARDAVTPASTGRPVAAEKTPVAADEAGPVPSHAGPSPARRAGPVRWVSWFFLAWGVGGAVLLLRLIGGKVYGHRIVVQAPAVDDPRLLAAVRRATARFGITRPIPVLESDHLKVPFVWGLFRPRLILPSGAVEWPFERVEAVLRHEMAHVKRRDLLVQFLAQVACCLYWINPLVWIMERKMFIERERSCDDMAIGRETKASDYAGYLMEVVEELGVTRNQVWVVSAMAEGTDFKDRILSVLDPAARRTAPKPGYTAAVIAVSAFLVLSLASLRPLSGATEAAPAARPTVESRAAAEPAREPAPAERIDAGRLEGLIESLGIADASIRRHAATALGELGDTRAVPPLIDALEDEDASVREHVATALGQIGNAAAAPPLCRLLLSDPVAGVREHVASALGQIGDAAATPPLGQALLADRDARVREHVASALGQIGDRTAIPSLSRVLREDTSERVREHVASALGQVGKDDDGAYRALVEAFENDDSVRVRAHAAFGLGLVGDRRAFDVLVGGLDSPHAEIRVECAEALGLLGDPRAVPHLEQFLNDPDERLRTRAQHSTQMLLEGR